MRETQKMAMESVEEEKDVFQHLLIPVMGQRMGEDQPTSQMLLTIVKKKKEK